MSTVKITKRERYESIIELAKLAEDNGFEGFDLEGISAFCQKEIVALDNRAEKARERAAAKRAEGDELQNAVFEALTDELATRQDIADRLEGEDISLAKVGYRLTSLVREGKAVKEEISVAGEDGKSKRVAAYKLA